MHIHIDGQNHTAKSLCNLAKMVYKNEDLIFQALNVSPE
ncbi:MAG: amidoligase family protein, partial [FCB group bacterium]|nr:amidoligase family protein [FCB group bacterium]